MILSNIEENLIFFYPPSRIKEAKKNQEFRLGGLVKANSLGKITPNEIKFTITDNMQEITVLYKGILPALFRENQGVVAVGKLSNDLFIARELLIKHDEKYYPYDNRK